MMNAARTGIALVFVIAAFAAAEELPYDGWEEREIKALSADEINGYLSGDGMRLALAAELNHYPGPRHVLELAGALALTAAQREQTQQLEMQMKREAIALGKAIVTAEAELDSLFSVSAANEESLIALVEKIAALKGELRVTHLKYHLRMKETLSAAQIARYDELRGYGDGKGHGAHGDHSH